MELFEDAFRIQEWGDYLLAATSMFVQQIVDIHSLKLT